MKKAVSRIIFVITVAAAVLTLGFFLLRNQSTEPPTLRYLGSPTHSSSDTMLVDINTATMEELMTLPGIGETFARRIIDYRQEHGPFTAITDLLKVEGIGETRFESIMDMIKIGGQHEDTGR